MADDLQELMQVAGQLFEERAMIATLEERLKVHAGRESNLHAKLNHLFGETLKRKPTTLVLDSGLCLHLSSDEKELFVLQKCEIKEKEKKDE